MRTNLLNQHTMRNILFFCLSMLIVACSPKIQQVKNIDLTGYHLPFRILTIGDWAPGFEVLILTDQDNRYITVKIKEAGLEVQRAPSLHGLPVRQGLTTPSGLPGKVIDQCFSLQLDG